MSARAYKTPKSKKSDDLMTMAEIARVAKKPVRNIVTAPPTPSIFAEDYARY